MSFLKFHQNERNDPPPAADEVQIHPGTLASPPVRIKADHPAAPIRQLHAHAKSLEREVAEKSAELESARQRAVEILDDYNDLLERRRGFADLITRGQNEIDSWPARAEERKNILRGHWLQGDAVDTHTVAEHLRDKLVVEELLPGMILEWKAAAKKLDQEIEEFCEEHEINEQTISGGS